MILPILLAVVLVVVGLFILILTLGAGDWSVGRVRLAEEVWAVRRDRIPELLDRLRAAAREAWRHPDQPTVAGQLRGIVEGLDRAARAAGGFVRAQSDLGRSVERLRRLAPLDDEELSGPRPRVLSVGRGWPAAAVLGLTALGIGTANVWGLMRLVVPLLSESPWFDIEAAGSLVGPVAVSVLPFLFGIVYYALGGEETPTAPLFRAAGAMLVAAIALTEGAAVVAALQVQTIALVWWGAVLVMVLLGSAAGLVPVVLAALGFVFMERFEHWMAIRDRAATLRAMTHRRETVVEIGRALDRLESGLPRFDMELRTLSSQGAGALFLDPEGEASLERSKAVLRQLARAVEGESRTLAEDPLDRGHIAFRLLRDGGALVLWLIAAVAALSLAFPSLTAAAGTEIPGVLAWAALAALGALLVGGAAVRWVLSHRSMRGEPAVRAALIVIVVFLVGVLAVTVGPVVAWAGLVEGGALEAGAWLSLVVLVAAILSIRLPEGISSAAAAVSAAGAVAGWLAVKGADLLLAGLSRLLMTGSEGDVMTPRLYEEPQPRLPTARDDEEEGGSLPTDAELQILQVLWTQGQGTVQEVAARLVDSTRADFSSVLQLIRTMHEKGLLERDESMGVHLYRPATGGGGSPAPDNEELEILRVLWRKGAGTAQDVAAQLEQEREILIATVQELFHSMHEKGLLERDDVTGMGVYRAAVDEQVMERRLAGNLIDRGFRGSAGRLAIRALSARDVSPEELAELRELVDRLGISYLPGAPRNSSS